MFDTAEWSCGPGSVPSEGQEFLATDRRASLPRSCVPAPPAGPRARMASQTDPAALLGVLGGAATTSEHAVSSSA